MKKIEALLELPILERTFTLDITDTSTEHSEASMSMGKKSAYNFTVLCILEYSLMFHLSKFLIFLFIGISEPKTKFVLSDLGNYLSSSTTVKEEKSAMVSVKPQVPPPRIKTQKKRKAIDNLDLEIFDGLSSFEALGKLQAIANLVKYLYTLWYLI